MQAPHVSYFGKLPAHADFVRGGDAAPSELDAWLREALAVAERRLGHRFVTCYDGAPPLRFLFPLPAGGYLAGLAVRSRDRSGRRFPFVVSLRSEPAADPGDLAIQMESFQRRAEEAVRSDSFDAAQLAGEGWRADDQTGVLRHIMAGTPLGSFAAGLGAADLRILVTRLQSAMEPLRGAPLPATGLGLRFPLGSDSGTAAMTVGVWIDLTLRVARHPEGPVTAFWWTGAGDPPERPSLFLSLGRAPAALFAHLLDPTLESDSVFDLDPGQAPAGVPPASSLTVLDFVQREGALSWSL
jgi:type VI secretion system protein ImpM